MKHCYAIVSTLFFFSLFSHSSAQSLDPVWTKCYGGSYSDWGEYLFPLQDGGFLMTGSSQSEDGDITDHHTDGLYIGYDYWVARCDSSGNIIWRKSYGGTGTDLGRGIVQPDATHYVVAGYAISNNDDISGNHGWYDLWLMKIDTSGNLLWGKTYGGSAEDDNWDLIETSDHGFMLTGATLSIDGDITSFHGLYDSWIVKTDSSGNLEWQKTFGGSNNEYFNQTLETPNGNYLAVGRTYSSDGDVSSSHGDCDVWVVKFDTVGNILWEKTYGGSAFEEAQAIVPAYGGGYLITGTTTSNDDDVSGNHGSSDVWVLKIDDDGNLLWQKCFGGTLPETSWGISALDGMYVISAESYSHNGDVSDNYGDKDGWVLITDSLGNLVDEKNFGGSGEDWMRMVKFSPNGTPYGIGTSASPDLDANNAHSQWDYFVVKFPPWCSPVTASFFVSANGPGYNFYDESSNATSWYWDFGDGTTDSIQNPFHEYSVSDNYEVCLIASNACSADTVCHNIKILVTGTDALFTDESGLEIFPNPLTDRSIVQFSLSKSSDIKIDLLDAAGRKIETIADENFVAGNHQLTISGENLSKGIYLMMLKTNSESTTAKLIIQ